MNRKYIYPILIILVTVGLYYLERYIDSGRYKASQTTVINSNADEFPLSLLPESKTADLVNHKYYSLSYSETHEQARWVAYQLRADQVVNNDFKRPYFEQDPLVSTASAHWRNYKNSGYDRGHLCAAADMEFDYDAFKDTFYTSNISPQLHEFNSRVWNFLEQRVRRWAKQNDGVFVITGGVLTQPLGSVGSEEVSIPSSFYKIIVDTYRDDYRVVAFLIPHREDIESYSDYITTVDDIEEATGIDFFAGLSKEDQNELESRIDRLYFDL